MVAAATLVLRLVAGAMFVVQGIRKLFAPPEVHHGRANLTNMIRSRGLPVPEQTALLMSGVELLCGTLVVVGLLTRVVILPLIVILLGAIVLFKIRDGFVGGWDWPLSVLGGSVAILLLGAGSYSLDSLLDLPW